MQAKLELELEILSEEESQLRPAGKARDDPNLNPKLDPPNRPKTSFFWLTSPWKTFRFIIWKNYKWHIIFIVLVILIIITIVIFVYTAPVSSHSVYYYIIQSIYRRMVLHVPKIALLQIG